MPGLSKDMWPVNQSMLVGFDLHRVRASHDPFCDSPGGQCQRLAADYAGNYEKSRATCSAYICRNGCHVNQAEAAINITNQLSHIP